MVSAARSRTAARKMRAPIRMASVKREFHFEEYRALRKEIEQRIAESGKVANLAAAWFGGVYGWLLKDDSLLLKMNSLTLTQRTILFLLPGIWTAFWSLARIAENEYKVKLLGKHILKIEHQFGVVGWEQRSGDGKVWQGAIVASIPLSFVVLVVVAALVFLW